MVCYHAESLGIKRYPTSDDVAVGYYPIEPHYHLPLVQFLPQNWQRSLVNGIGRTPYENLNLLTKRQFQRLIAYRAP
jgi:hypothetical protein